MVMEHKVFFTELLSLCETDDQSLQKLPCYKSISNLVPLRKSALRALSACHYIPECREKIFTVLYQKALNSHNNELVEAGYECMKKFTAGFKIDMETVTNMTRTMLQTLGDYRNLNINMITRLYYLAELFPTVFNEKLCEQLLQLLKKWLEAAILGFKQMNQAGGNKSGGQHQLKVAASIVRLFQKIPPSHTPQKIIEMLCKLILTTERNLFIEPGSILREPLMGYLAKFPSETLDFLMGDQFAKDAHHGRFAVFIVDHKDGQVFRDALKAKNDRLIQMINCTNPAVVAVAQQQQQQQQQQPQQVPPITLDQRYEIQFVGVNLVWTLLSHENSWIKGQSDLIGAIKKLWNQDIYHDRHRKGDGVDYTHWREPKIVVKILLEYFKHHKDNEILLLFQLLRALCGRFVADFQYLKEFLELEICQAYPVEWKRAAFFEFVRLWNLSETTLSQELKGKILQYIIIPCFSFSFDHNEGDALIGSPPAPDQDCPENVVSTFINKIIDPENPFGTSDTVRILLLQFSCLLVDQGAAHIHDASNKKQGNKLRRLMTYAWPCLISKNCVDPATR